MSCPDENINCSERSGCICVQKMSAAWIIIKAFPTFVIRKFIAVIDNTNVNQKEERSVVPYTSEKSNFFQKKNILEFVK